ncbi:MAG TPA: hypothetical protein VI248_08895 [Kineosporiaceae bacterium]
MTPALASQFPPILSSRLDAIRREAFIGRYDITTEFLRSLRGGERRVFLVHGRRGFGKTMLLRELARQARQAGRVAVELDGRSRTRMAEQLRGHLLPPDARGLGGARPPHGHSPEPIPVLLIDDADDVEDWVRNDVLPQLPASVLLVMTTTAPMSPQWGVDPGWRSVVHGEHLAPFTAEESVDLLGQLGVDPREHERLWYLTDGHPLSLSLLGRHWSAHGFTYLSAPDLVDSLLETLVGIPPDQHCCEALYVCAHAVSVNEDTLRVVLGADHASTAWRWLRSLGVTQQTGEGLRMNEFVRQLVEEHTMRRMPDRGLELHAAVHDYAHVRMVQQLQDSGYCIGPVRNLFAGHESSALSRLWEGPEAARIWNRVARSNEHQEAVELIRRAAGESDMGLAHHWLTRQPESLYVGECDGELVAVAMNLKLTEADARQCADPVVEAVLGSLDSAGLMRSGDTVHLLRFVADDAGRQDSAVATYVGLAAAVANWLAGEPSVGVAVGAFGRRSQQVLDDLALIPLDIADRLAEQVRYFDFRRFPVRDWFDFLVNHGLRGGFSLPDSWLRPPPLTYGEFARAVQRALQDLHRLDRLAANPLTGTSLVADMDLLPAQALQRRLIMAVDSIGSSARDRPLARVLEVSYLQVATSQKAAAKLLDLPFSTYRRYLAKGVERLVDMLWASEVSPSPPESGSRYASGAR